MNIDFQNWSHHRKLQQWICSMQELCRPYDVYLCDGSLQEYEMLCDLLVAQGTFIPLNSEKRPGSFLARSDPSDVARVEERTFICSKRKEDAGLTNNWCDPQKMHETLDQLFDGCMQGRKMYVVPFSMGPYGSAHSIVGVEITDSPYVVVNMHKMTRMGKKALEVLGESGEFIPCMHSVGMPLTADSQDVPWPCSQTKYIVHFPEEKSIFSYGSGYGGNALLGKKCLALRIASCKAHEEGWLAEHMLILGLTNPQGEKKYIAAAFPSACGKTNLAMITPSLPGWRVECVGDDIAWMKIGSDGRLYAINPEKGFFGVAPGTSWASNPNAMETIEKNTIFTNVALTDDGDVWWEGMTSEPPKHLTSWKNMPWDPSLQEPSSHPNARFTVEAAQCPIISQEIDNPIGVPISAVIFGGRRASLEPLVYEALDWNHGVFLGASLTSEMTAAAKGVVGQVRHDPFAMLPFCGYNMADYFAHWLSMQEKTAEEKLPKIFHVNWFKKDQQGKFLWPGFGENSRVLQWIFGRVSGTYGAKKKALGLFPTVEDLAIFNVSKEQANELFFIDHELWLEETEKLQEYFSSFGPRLPKEIFHQLIQLKQRIGEIDADAYTKSQASQSHR